MSNKDTYHKKYGNVGIALSAIGIFMAFESYEKMSVEMTGNEPFVPEAVFVIPIAFLLCSILIRLKVFKL
ncbi:hypothetical protein [Vibrio europaeus]|jgi:hypothetical protein|uniref:DUF3098 domain-containing protein n=1 Tax=Vibrio europaeus TaxID=300876 RepID=A0ABT5GRE6_9VIBR|nr:hypothetical protein [Vibrio europaeus]MDC5725727.1 hypothetical protein [Vibrio europaeus]MDC5728329.1 hypothetical protein [Vibrio europaeus]MDC5734541.1 hypothetical protein [Vibrio europaeus]MDC5739822.1 hypothetical protein [Vibrio europaeus]